MRTKRFPRKAQCIQQHTMLSIECLEDRRVLSFTPNAGSFEAINNVSTTASAGSQQGISSSFSRTTDFGTRLNASSIAGANGATANNIATSAGTISSGSPELFASAAHTAIATASAAEFAGSLAGTQRSSATTLDGSYTAQTDGILSVVLTARLWASTDANKGAYSQAISNFFGELLVNGAVVAGVDGDASIRSIGPDGVDAGSIQQTQLTVTRPGGTQDTFAVTDFAQPFVYSLDVQLAIVLRFTVAINSGDVVTLDASESFGSGQNARSDSRASSPSTGVENAISSGSATLSIETSFEATEDPSEDDEGFSSIWRLWNEPPTDDDGGGGGGDIDGDGDVDDDDRRALPDYPTALIVTTADDELDDPVLNPAGYDQNDISLREALALAANQAGNDMILFAPWIGEITLGSQLTVDSDVRIVGRGADKLTINGNNSSRIFHLNASTVDATISGMKLTGGKVTGGSSVGGAVLTDGNLTLSSVDVVSNQAGGKGGGIFVNATGALTVARSTFSLNTANTGGGAISGNFKAGTALNITDSTFSNNTSGSGGAILYYSNETGTTNLSIHNSTFSANWSNGNGGALLFQKGASSAGMTASITNSTIAHNSAIPPATAGLGGGIYNTSSAAVVTLHNTIVAKNTASNTTYHDVSGSVTGGGASSHNLIGQVGSSGLTNVTGNKVGTATVLIDPLLAPLGYYGGKTKTHALLLNSPALDAGKDSIASAFDQRGYARDYDLPVTNGIGGSSDIGAYEAGVGTALIVRSDGDRNNAINLTATVASLRLREALALAGALAGSETISFDKSLYTTSPAHIVLSYDGTDAGSAPDSLTIPAGVSLAGPRAHDVIVDGNDLTRVFYINAIPGDEPISLEGLTITGGASDVGAGIWVSDADLTLRGVRVVENAASNAGGGIYSENVERLLVSSSEISGNTVGTNGAGGGIYDHRDLDSEPGLQVINSTISGNTVAGASGKGGGLYLYRDADSSTVLLPIISATIAFNTAASGGGVYSATLTGSAFVQIRNSIVTDNVNLSAAANNVAGLNFNSGSYNLIGLGGSGGLLNNNSGNIVLSGAEPSGLESLSYYGGSTKTHALRYDSAAIDAGFDDYADDWDLEFDQRGVDRISDNDYVLGDGIDIGAMELFFDEIYS
ncbi:MAG: hypothetical protein JNL18_07910 [Planctomycetaceae bacterium]|nr:hypothetical protein [Planctomycetaceae bacterium]